MKIERWGTTAKGRSHTVAHGDMVWTVSNTSKPHGNFIEQVDETLAFLQVSLHKAGTDKCNLLSVQVILTDIANRDAFNERWCTWIGENPENWPQRAVFGGSLAPGLLTEVIATACRQVGAKPSEA